MNIYQFFFRARGAQVEPLGALPLGNDTEAIAFGQSVVRDMIREAPREAAVVEVVAGGRTVGRIRRGEVI